MALLTLGYAGLARASADTIVLNAESVIGASSINEAEDGFRDKARRLFNEQEAALVRGEPAPTPYLSSGTITIDLGDSHTLGEIVFYVVGSEMASRSRLSFRVLASDRVKPDGKHGMTLSGVPETILRSSLGSRRPRPGITAQAFAVPLPNRQRYLQIELEPTLNAQACCHGVAGIAEVRMKLARLDAPVPIIPAPNLVAETGGRADLSVVKSQRLVSDPFRGTPGIFAVPASIVEYCLVVSNPGPKEASDIRIVDPIPDNLEFVQDSLFVSVTIDEQQRCRADGQLSSTTGGGSPALVGVQSGAVNVQLARLGVGERYAVRFSTRVK